MNLVTLLPALSLMRADGSAWVHCANDGRWFEAAGPIPQPTAASGAVAFEPGQLTELADGPELRSLLAYAGGFIVGGFFRTVAVEVPGGGWKELGTMPAEFPAGTGFGAFSQAWETWTEPRTLNRGHKAVLVKASPSKPLKVRTICSVLCGRRVSEGYVPAGFVQ